MIIKCKKSHLVARCFERGYSVLNALPCIVAHTGDHILVDTEHPAYPREKKEPYETLVEQISNIDIAPKPSAASKLLPPPTQQIGPGTELKKMLAKIGIKATPTCSCNKRAQIMDEKGVQWCKDNIEVIVGWLREEAEKRKLPFVDMAGRLLVKRAISLAEKDEKKRRAEEAKENSKDG